MTGLELLNWLQEQSLEDLELEVLIRFDSIYSFGDLKVKISEDVIEITCNHSGFELTSNSGYD